MANDYYIEYDSQGNEVIKKKNNKRSSEHKKGKLICRFEVQVPASSKFEVAKRIIGIKGSNMREVLAYCQHLEGAEEVTIRLRGKGSGHKEGPELRESDDPLHLCVSARNINTFKFVCKLIESLMMKIYKDYQEFEYLRSGKIPPLLTVLRKEGISTAKYN